MPKADPWRLKWLIGMGAPLLLLSLAGGCSNSPYVSGYSYYPQPAVVQVFRRAGAAQSGQASQTPLTALATVLGIHQGDQKQHIPYSVAIRLRFENNGPSRVSFDPHTLELVTGTLMAFAPPITEPPNATVLGPGQRQEFVAYFPFPPNIKADQMNLEHFRLRWQVQIDNYPVVQTALFDRAQSGEPGYDQPPPQSPPSNGDVY
ncbi:MAG TPA: hypothetical protein VN541_23625 [Tepidisphaeraceae bacterium]|nr:hypothetical protein [Tepidisphaeraceae bacterium]